MASGADIKRQFHQVAAILQQNDIGFLFHQGGSIGMNDGFSGNEPIVETEHFFIQGKKYPGTTLESYR